LSNERTALAGVRTALAVIAAGVGLAALVHATDLSDFLRWCAAALCLAGALLAISTVVRWARVERAMRLDVTLPAPTGLHIVVVIVAVVGLGIALLILLELAG
jgi:putative membrane protein